MDNDSSAVSYMTELEETSSVYASDEKKSIVIYFVLFCLIIVIFFFYFQIKFSIKFLLIVSVSHIC